MTGSGPDRRIGAEVARDEQEQADYLRQLLAIHEEEGIDTAFWFTFANYDKPRREDPERDLDLASYGLVAVLEPEDDRANETLVPKLAFAALAEHPHRSTLRPPEQAGRAEESARR